MWTVLSFDPEATRLPPGDQSNVVIMPVCLVYLQRRLLDATSQICTFPSNPMAIKFPRGDQANVLTSQTCTVLSTEPEATRRPSGDQPNVVTLSVWSV